METFMQYFTHMVTVLSEAGVEIAEMAVGLAIAYGAWVIILEAMFYGFFLIIILKGFKAISSLIIEKKFVHNHEIGSYKFKRDVRLNEDGSDLVLDFAETICTGEHLENGYSLIGEEKEEAIIRFAKKYGLELKHSDKKEDE